MINRKILLVSASTLTLLSSQHAFAQTTAESLPVALEEIVVTAEKREMNVQKTPISIQVYTAEALRDKGIGDLRELQLTDTSFQVAPTSSGHPSLAIRGILSTNASQTGEPANPVAIDGIFNNRGYSLNSGFYDLERIEVLRGPQGTLFGRNTMGGMLSIVTAKPKLDQTSARLTADFGNYGAQFIDGYLNLPATDQLAARISFQSRKREGYYRDTQSDARGGDIDTRSARFQLLYKPTEHLTGWFSAGLDLVGGVSAGEKLPFLYPANVPINPATLAPANPAPAGASGYEPLHIFPPGLSDGKAFAFNGAQPNRIETTDFKYSLAYDNLPGGMSLFYLGGFNRIDFIQPISSLYIARTNRAANKASLYTRRENPTTVQNELRLSSATDGPLVWQAGVYAFRETSHEFTSNQLQNGPQVLSPSNLIYTFDAPHINQRSRAIFAQGSYSFSDSVKLTAGARYTKDDKSFRQLFILYPPATGAPVALAPRLTEFRTSSDKVTWLVGADYQLTDRNLLYAKVSTGYKAGSAGLAGAWKPESVISYEVGTKNRFFDDKVQLNLSAYYMDYTDMQVTAYLTVPGSSVALQTTTNAAKATIYGLEGNFIAKLTPNDRVNVSANYLHARYDEFLAAANWTTPTTPLDLSGNRLPSAPDLSVSIGYDHTFNDVFNGDLTASVQMRAQSSQFLAQENFANQRVGTYTLTDATLTYSRPDTDWTVQAWVKNIADTDYLVTAQENVPFGVYIFGRGLPRTFGVRFSSEF